LAEEFLIHYLKMKIKLNIVIARISALL